VSILSLYTLCNIFRPSSCPAHSHPAGICFCIHRYFREPRFPACQFSLALITLPPCPTFSPSQVRSGHPASPSNPLRFPRFMQRHCPPTVTFNHCFSTPKLPLRQTFYLFDPLHPPVSHLSTLLFPRFDQHALSRLQAPFRFKAALQIATRPSPVCLVIVRIIVEGCGSNNTSDSFPPSWPLHYSMENFVFCVL